MSNLKNVRLHPVASGQAGHHDPQHASKTNVLDEVVCTWSELTGVTLRLARRGADVEGLPLRIRGIPSHNITYISVQAWPSAPIQDGDPSFAQPWRYLLGAYTRVPVGVRVNLFLLLR